MHKTPNMSGGEAPAKSLTLAFTGTHGNLSWVQAHDAPDDAMLVCGGYLFADPAAKFRLMEALLRAPRTVEPTSESTYMFTDERDTPADLAAAMLLCGNGDGELSGDGWGVLQASPHYTAHVHG